MGQLKLKKQLTAADYSLWGTLQLEALSEKGNWATYTMHYDQKQADTLFLKHTKIKKTIAIPKASQGIFNHENQFVCLTPEGMLEVDLKTTKKTLLPNVEAFTFAADGNYLLIVKKETNKQKSLIIKATHGKGTKTIENVGTFQLNEKTNKIVYAIESDKYQALIVADLNDGISEKIVLEDPKYKFTHLTWNDSGNTVALFMQSVDPTTPIKNKIACYHANENKLKYFSLEENTNSADSMQIDVSQTIPLTISEDGHRVFFGIKEKEKLENKIDPKTVQIWRTTDNWIYPQQKSIQNWKKTVKTALWETNSNQFLQISSIAYPKLMLDGKQQWALVFNPIAAHSQYKYNDDRDYYVKNLQTGESKLIIEQLPENNQHILAVPNTNYILYYKDKNWWALDLNSLRKTNLTEQLNINFEDVNYDRGGDKPTYGIAGWDEKNNSILLYDQYDLWAISIDGKLRSKLTTGREKQICFRIPKHKNGTWNKINFDGLSCSKVALDTGLILEANGANLFSGYYKWNSEQKESKIIYTNQSLDQFIKASKSNSYIYREQKYNSPPALLFNELSINGYSKTKPQKLFESNPQHHNYHWGKSELVYYQNTQGKTLKGILYYPAAYNPKIKYPMIVDIYEKQSQELHHYINPTELDSKGTCRTNYTTQGYFYLMPDIVYEIGKPGISALDCVVAATQSIIDKGVVNPNKIGLTGHSFGGYESSFIVTKTKLFATAIIGAAATDLSSWYLTVGWNTGRPEFWRFENQQWRMGKSLFEDRDAYNQNSPIQHAGNVTIPLLIWTGENDKQVHANQSIEFYLGLKRLEKKATMLVYPNEGHALRNERSQRDLSQRTLNWFDHYLKDKTPAPWMLEMKK